MTLKSRFSLIGLGIIIFLIITPILMLYARGFQIDWQKRQFVKTGTLVVKTEPNGASVYLNNKLQNSTTPGSFRFLIPNDYHIRLEKEGYQTWFKRLNIRAQFVTWVNLDRSFTALFLKQPTLEQAWDINRAEISKTGTEISFSKNDQASSIDVLNNNITNFGNISNINKGLLIPQSVEIRWQNATKILELLQSRDKWSLTDKQISNISVLESNGNHYLAKINSDLFLMDNPTPLLIDKNITIFTLDNDFVWYIQGSSLKRYDSTNGGTEIINSGLPVGSSGQIIRSDNQVYIILDGKLYVINDLLEKIYDNVSQASWNAESKQLLFSNNNEILIYNPSDKSTELILRSSTPISNPILNWQTGYVFFANEGKIKAMELDMRDQRNVFSLIEQTGVAPSFSLSADGRTLYTVNETEIKRYKIR